MSTNEINTKEADAKRISEPESVIQFFLDQFKIKSTILNYTNEETSLRISSRLFDTLILFFFLLFVFWETGILNLEWSSVTVILGVIALVALTEFLGINTTLFKRFISKDEKSKIFFRNINSMTHNEMMQFAKFHVFSPKCINYLLEKLKEDKNQMPPDIVEYILTTQDLTKGNLDLMFSQEVMGNIRESAICNTLFRKRNQLTQQNIADIYETFKGNEKIIKMLTATQCDSYIALEKFKDDLRLLNYYNAFQIKRQHFDFWLKFFPISHLSLIRRILTFLSFPCTFILIVLFYTLEPQLLPADPITLSIQLFVMPLFLMVCVDLILRRIDARLMMCYINRFIFKLESSDQSIKLLTPSKCSPNG
jgi:hypothetical protein